MRQLDHYANPSFGSLCVAALWCCVQACSSSPADSPASSSAGGGSSGSAAGGGGAAASHGGSASSAGTSAGGASGMATGGQGGGLGGTGGVATAGATGLGGSAGQASGPAIRTVFIVLEENHAWSTIKGNSDAPYINQLATTFARSERYRIPATGLKPSEPNYIWLEAGSNFGVTDDAEPSSNLQRNRAHLSKSLDAKGISWRSYQDSISAGTCPVQSASPFAAKHDPFLFFDDVVGDPPSDKNAYCIAHHKPASELAADIQAGKVARYNFITPNLQHDMHDGTIRQADDWLKQTLSPLLDPANPSFNQAVYDHMALFVTWDEVGAGSQAPIGMIIVSPFAKAGYSDQQGSVYYDHSSTLRTFQEIFGVTNMPLGAAQSAQSLSEFFTTFP